MRPVLRTVLVGSLAVAPLVATSFGAFAADTTVGASPTPTQGCTNAGYTYLQGRSAAPKFAVAGAGVITSFRIPGDSMVASSRSFKVARPKTGGGFTVVATSPTTSVPGGGVLAQSTRIPVQAGDVIGLYVSSTTGCSVAGSGGDGVVPIPGDAGPGTDVGSGDVDGKRLSVSAVVEPDTDGDLYGDSTQDKCLGSIAINPCFAAPLGKPSGKAKVGKTLTVPLVTVPATGVSVSFQWVRVTKKKGKTVLKPIAGATGSTYKIKGKDRGKKLQVKVTLSAPGFASGFGYSGTKKAH